MHSANVMLTFGVLFPVIASTWQ